MSGIIYGNIRFDNEKININNNYEVLKAVDYYKIDKYKYVESDNYYIGCGIQYITEESLNETLPFNDNESLVITADAIIDNREELLKKLQLENHSVNDFTDSQYILMAYKRWGTDCPKYLLGDFTFAIWDERKKQLFCVRDQVGKRSFYYYYDNNQIIFSTLLKPISEVLNIKEKNEKWLVENLAIMGALSSCSIDETMYANIFKLPPATSMIIDKNGSKLVNYWNPINSVETVQFNTDEEYEKLFKETLTEAVKCRLRTNSNVGIMLSSGLDSASVGTIAADILSKEKKDLFSFTSIPLSENNNIHIKGRCINETEGVKLLAEKFKNIKTNFCEIRQLNSINKLELYNEVLEGPYKTIENIYWYLGLALEARQANCRILLDGQFGNLTISYGEYYTYLLTLIKNMKLVKLNNELKVINSKYKIGKKRLCKQMIELITPYKIRRKKENSDRYIWTSVNKELIKKYNMNRCLDKRNLNMFPPRYIDWDETKKLIVNFENLSHLGEYETKVSLYSGLLKRDPTKDVRVIEMVLSFPIEQFLKNGQERSLVKRAMKGMVPDEILNGKFSRGLQAADWLQRLKSNWDDLYSNLELMVKDEIANYYFDINKMNNYIHKYKNFKENYSESEKYEIRTLLCAFVFYNYLKNTF